MCGSWLAVRTNGTDVGHWLLPAMLFLGAFGGALYALIPAICAFVPALSAAANFTWFIGVGLGFAIYAGLMLRKRAPAAEVTPAEDYRLPGAA